MHILRCTHGTESADPGRRAQSSSSYVESKICHKIQNPKSPNSKIQNPQNPKSPKSPKSKIPKIQNPKSPKSKIPKIQNPKSEIPKSKIHQIQNPKSPKSKIPEIWGHIKICYITVQKSKIPKIGQKSLDFGLGILDFGFRFQNPKSPRSKIQNHQNPKSPKSKIPNPKSPRSKTKIPKIPKIFRQNPKFGALGASHKDLLHNDPKSKTPKIQNLGILDFGFWIRGIWDFGFWDFGSWGFWILEILVLLGRSRGCTTRQFGDGAWRSEARIPPGPPFRDSAKPTISDIVGARKQIELQKPGAEEVKTIFYTHFYTISRCLHACLSYYCKITIQIPKSKPTLSDTVGKG